MRTTWLLRVLVLASILAGAALLIWITRVREVQRPDDGRLRVITTILPIYDFARSVGGRDVIVRNLLPAGAEPHGFAMTPRDIAVCTEADLIIANGCGLDDYVSEAIIRARITRKPIVVLSDGLPRLGAEGAHDHSHEGASAGHDECAQGDPHYWLDPLSARTYVRKIAEALVANGVDKAAVMARADALDTELATLHADYARTLAPARGKGFIAFHAAYGHLAARYDLRQAAIWQTTPGREPSPREVDALLATARRERVSGLISEPQFSSKAIDMIARDARLPIVVFDPMGTAADLDAANYVPVMRRNLEALKDLFGLRPRR